MSLYETLIHELKIKLKKNKFNDIVTLINNQRYDESIEIIDDISMRTLIENIVIERERIGNVMEIKLNNLIWLNERLIQFDREPQLTKTKALHILKTVFINIYDLESEKYVETTKKLLRNDLRKNPERRYPLCYAKNNETLKCFLIKI